MGCPACPRTQKNRLDKLAAGSGRNCTRLKPGEQAIGSGDNITVNQADTNSAIAWKNGKFLFRNEPLESIMLKVARWYNVTITYEDNEVRKKLFGGIISKDKNASEVLQMLESTGEVHFKIEGRRVWVMP